MKHYSCLHHQAHYTLVCSSCFQPLCKTCQTVHQKNHKLLLIEEVSKVDNQNVYDYLLKSQQQSLNLLDAMTHKINELVTQYEQYLVEKFEEQARSAKRYSSLEEKKFKILQQLDQNNLQDSIKAIVEIYNQNCNQKKHLQKFLSIHQDLAYRVDQSLKLFSKLLAQSQLFESENVDELPSIDSPGHKIPNSFKGNRSYQGDIDNHAFSFSSKFHQRDLSPVGQFFSNSGHPFESVKKTLFTEPNAKTEQNFEQSTPQNHQFDSKIIHTESLISSQVIAKVPKVLKTIFPDNFKPMKYSRSLSIKAHDKAIQALILIDEESIATASNSIKVWNLHTLQEKYELKMNQGLVHCLDYNKSLQYLAAGGMDKKVWVWKHKTLKATLLGHFDRVRCVQFFQNDTLLASGSDDTSLIIWSMNFEKVRHLTDIDNGRISTINSTESHLVVGCNKQIMFYELKGYKNVKTLNAHENLVLCVIIVEPEQNVSLIKPQKVGRNNLSQRNRLSLLGGKFENRVIVSGGKDFCIKLWNYVNYENIYTFKEQYFPQQIIFLKRINCLGICLKGYEREGKIIVWNIESSEDAFVCCEILDNGTGVNAMQAVELESTLMLIAGFENKKIDKFELFPDK